MQKDKIFITNIAKKYETLTFIGREPIDRMTGLEVTFNNQPITNINITIDTTEPMTEEEIKDKIIEVLQ